MIVTSDMDVLSFCDGFNNHHIGTLRCRQEGASTPSTEKFGAEFPDLMARAYHELNADGGGPTVEYVRAVLSGDPQAIARTAMELTGGRLNLYDGMHPGDVGVYPDLILRAAAGITTISVNDDDNDDDEQSARELIEQIKDEGLSPTAPEPVYRAPVPEIESRTGQAPDDPRYTGPQPILLDLDGNGIRITEQSRSRMFVDAGGDGLRHRTAWAGIITGCPQLNRKSPVLALGSDRCIVLNWG
ncbi:hypothetical protein [Phaeovulum sp.]|uniref:hypothetical protein n=1 Tax=Phaeovulum sp. TaxID=2934796 RepID=UPI002731157F|nr:hypothetical protein [Phaeovulum sp.]MDP1668672.1 hypothetical protein [Phaeovulum sp.]